MQSNLSILIGGIQGEGVISTGLNLMKTLSSLGYYTYGNRKFSSRIKGGNTTINIHISIDKNLCVENSFDIILALDGETIDLYKNQVKESGILVYDSILSNKISTDPEFNAIPLPITETAKKLGAPTMKNTYAVGFLGKILGFPQARLKDSLIKTYGSKGEEVLQKNISILEEAFNYDYPTVKESNYILRKVENPQNRGVMLGNEAIGLGALAAGCRFVASYPITPASEVMEYLGKVLPRYGGAMVQVEDEIAAVTMVIGSSYTGVRSMTATSGPGISLMTEGIGLAGITEVPLVIVDVQRAGPSTGLPTKHEQSDLFTLYYGGHGEYPSIILAPSTVEECFYDTIRAFNLADQYQCPVILLSDLTLGLSPQTIDDLDYSKITIDRGKIASQEELLSINPGEFKRFSFTEDGISPRSFPGTPHGGHHVTGVEHNELGIPYEERKNREKMMEKRMSKIVPLEESAEVNIISHDNDVLFLTFGSTFGVVDQAVKLSGNKVDYGVIKMIRPLPKKQLRKLLEKYRAVVIVENNYRGQLASIIQNELGYHDKIRNVNKYDGNPFTANEILSQIGAWI